MTGRAKAWLARVGDAGELLGDTPQPALHGRIVRLLVRFNEFRGTPLFAETVRTVVLRVALDVMRTTRPVWSRKSAAVQSVLMSAPYPNAKPGPELR